MSAWATETSDAGDEQFVSIPQGGPIYVPHMVGPLTRVSDFESSAFDELQKLKAEIGWDSLEICEDEICVDDLKIIKEEELVNRAFEEAFEDQQMMECDAQKSEEQSCQRELDDNTASVTLNPCIRRSDGRRDTSVSCESSSGAHKDCKKTQSKDNISEKKKRKRHVKPENFDLEEGYVSKVQELARIKQKQDEDKRSTRLHSFNGGSHTNQYASSSQSQSDKMISLKSRSFSAKVRSSNAFECVPVHFPEVILCLEVYHNRRTSSKVQEFLVLGQQFLTEVRDKIYCLNDEIMKKAGQHDPSGYFLVEDVFCNDTREPCALDYSKPIFEWLELCRNDALEKWEFITSGEQQPHQKQKAFLDDNEKLQLPRFRAVEMQKSRFCDLRFRIGAGYLYCHQGDCKHLIIIRDMRLIHPEDVQNRAAYPLITFQSKVRFRKCSVCKIYKATKLTVDDKWAQENPCYFCDLCYYMLHYANGSLLYNDFSVHDYLHE